MASHASILRDFLAPRRSKAAKVALSRQKQAFDSAQVVSRDLQVEPKHIVSQEMLGRMGSGQLAIRILNIASRLLSGIKPDIVESDQLIEGIHDAATSLCLILDATRPARSVSESMAGTSEDLAATENFSISPSTSLPLLSVNRSIRDQVLPQLSSNDVFDFGDDLRAVHAFLIGIGPGARQMIRSVRLKVVSWHVPETKALMQGVANSRALLRAMTMTMAVNDRLKLLFPRAAL